LLLEAVDRLLVRLLVGLGDALLVERLLFGLDLSLELAEGLLLLHDLGPGGAQILVDGCEEARVLRRGARSGRGNRHRRGSGSGSGSRLGSRRGLLFDGRILAALL